MADDKVILTVILELALAARVDEAARAAQRTRASYVRNLLEQTHPKQEVKKR